jgi:hypothetical protein
VPSNGRPPLRLVKSEENQERAYIPQDLETRLSAQGRADWKWALSGRWTLNPHV